MNHKVPLQENHDYFGGTFPKVVQLNGELIRTRITHDRIIIGCTSFSESVLQAAINEMKRVETLPTSLME